MKISDVPRPVWEYLSTLHEGTQCIAVYEIGSNAHGTHIPPEDGGVDDRDYMAIMGPSKRLTYGLQTWEGAQRQWDEDGTRWDVVVYTLPKLVKLLMKGNPNVLSLLWARPLWHTPLFTDFCVTGRKLFATQQPSTAFFGYVLGQIHRMNNPAHEGYMGAKRKALFDKHGYDTKNAAHAYRLMTMLGEFMLSGEMMNDRTQIDAPLIKDIKRGKFTLDEATAMIHAARTEAERCTRASLLPLEPSARSVENVLLATLEAYWASTGESVDPYYSLH